jgi:outer membrane receptor protein involved in Fe transport
MKFFEDPRRGLLANPDIKAERAWAYQIGLESQPLRVLWSRCSLYRSDNRNAIALSIDPASGTAMMKNFAHERRQGGELEFKAAFSNGFWASVGGSFNDVRQLPSHTSFWTLSAGEVTKDRPRVVYDVGVGYWGKGGLRLNLAGDYTWWNAPKEYKADDRKFIWDTKVSQELRFFSLGPLEIFAAVHNVFDTPYSRTDLYPRPRRWFEGGLNCVL